MFPNTSKTLLERIRRGDGISWKDFYQRYNGIIRTMGLQNGLRTADCDDLVQNVMLSIFKSATTMWYEPKRAHFRTYFQTIVRTQIANYYRTKYAQLETINLDDANDADMLPEAREQFERQFAEQWHREVFQDAMSILRSKVNPETYMIFEFLVKQHRPVTEVKELLDCTDNKIYLAKMRCREKLQEIVTELLGADDSMNVDDFLR